MVQMGMLQGDSLNQALGSISSNLQRIIGLTNDILFLQEMDLIFSDFEEINLVELFQKLIAEFAGLAEEMGVSVRLLNEATSISVLGDRKSIERSFSALLDNAIKFSLDGGEVTVDISSDGSNVLVSIKDEGIGIPEENLQRIFERFWRTEEFNGHLFGGIGLGLAIAKQVVEQHRGEIFVESKPGEGSVFNVTMPQKGPAALSE
jgi:signal transduction histidine kinase